MKKLLATACLAMTMLTAHADELGDAKKLFEQKQYPQAMEIYARLANAGNSEAQQLLGEMYWYGEGTAVDNAKAEMWFTKAAEAGNAKAKAALGVMRDRVTRRADIDYYVQRYDGANLKYDCARPAIPEMSKSFAEAKTVQAEYGRWAECHNGFIMKLNAMNPPEKAIPADIANLMTEDEFTRAQALAGKARDAAAARAQSEAAAVAKLNDTWQELTVRYLKNPQRTKYGTGTNEQEMALMRQLEEQQRYRMQSVQPAARR